jgi:hypothetical protein
MSGRSVHEFNRLEVPGGSLAVANTVVATTRSQAAESASNSSVPAPSLSLREASHQPLTHPDQVL